MPQFPVIIFSHGFRGTRDTNTAQCEELASYGYIVVGISHTYDSCVVQFPDGRIVDGLKSIAQRTSKFGNFDKVVHEEAEIWIADTQFALDQVEQLANDTNSFFYQRIDQKHIGMFGHSMGGSTALQAGHIDRRIKAAVNLDGDLFGYHVPKKIEKPAMNILGGNEVTLHERPFTHNEWKRFNIHSEEEEKQSKASFLPVLKQLAQSADHVFYTFVIKDAGHFDLADLAPYKAASFVIRFLARYDFAGMRIGSIDGLKTAHIINDYLVNFFDKYLKNKSSTLLDGQEKRYAEVEAKNWANK
jgi:predicted dienelactone hydrolase